MKISGFTMVRNGEKMGYPFTESIRSALPICDEYIVVIGKSEDDTREQVAAIGSEKIRIIDTVWDEQLRIGGRILAQQTNVALDEISGDWGVYLQADEVIHEKDYDAIVREMELCQNDPKIEGLLFDYNHFWGYKHVCVTRRTYRREIRVIRNLKNIRSYKDAQGFRKYPSIEAYENGHPGFKLQVKHIKPKIYAYSRVRNPKLELEKQKMLDQWWHPDDKIAERYKDKAEFNYEQVDKVVEFDQKDHPQTMQKRAAECEWEFKFKRPNFTAKNRVLHTIEELTGWRIGEYRNYKIVEKSKKHP